MNKIEVLEKAIETVKDRGVPYGGVEDNFARIAHLWNGYMRGRFADGAGGDTVMAVPSFAPGDVAAMMALMKLGRIAGNPAHMDSWIDLAGYAACGGEIGAHALKPPTPVLTDPLEIARAEQWASRSEHVAASMIQVKGA